MASPGCQLAEEVAETELVACLKSLGYDKQRFGTLNRDYELVAPGKNFNSSNSQRFFAVVHFLAKTLHLEVGKPARGTVIPKPGALRPGQYLLKHSRTNCLVPYPGRTEGPISGVESCTSFKLDSRSPHESC